MNYKCLSLYNKLQTFSANNTSSSSSTISSIVAIKIFPDTPSRYTCTYQFIRINQSIQIKQDNSCDNPRIVQVKLLAPPAKRNLSPPERISLFTSTTLPSPVLTAKWRKTPYKVWIIKRKIQALLFLRLKTRKYWLAPRGLAVLPRLVTVWVNEKYHIQLLNPLLVIDTLASLDSHPTFHRPLQ